MTANAKNLSTLANVLDDGTNGQFLQSTGSGGIVFADVAAGASVYDSAELLPLSGNDAGDMAFVNSTNRFYINNGTGWYSISLVNTNPNITSVQDASAGTTPFTLATDGTATVITITANDPEQVPLTYNYSVTSGSLTNGGGTTATVAQSDNVFTVTPSSTEAYAGIFELTFTASDGINTATNANSFTLEFITIVTNSKYTTLLASVASNSPYSLPSANNQVSSFSVNSQTSSPTEVVFGDSGTKMFVLSSDRYVYSYNLSTAYDASTASYVATSSELTQFTTNTSESFRFKPDGTVMFVSGSNGYVYQYSLSTAWDVSTIAYASKSVQHPNSTHSYKALTFKPDGTRIYMAGLRYVLSMTLGSPWDIGSTTPDNTSNGFTDNVLNLGWVYGHTITGMDFNSTGTSLTMVYGAGNATDKYIIEHPIDDAWNVSNATALGSAPSTTYQQNSIQGLAYANDGNTLVTVLDTGDTVYTYDTSFNGVNNNITDASTNNHTISVNGDAHAGTFSPYRSGGYSTYFDGNGDFLQNSDGIGAGEVGSGAFCIEAWVYKESNGNFDCVCSLGTGAGSYQFEVGNGSNLVQWEDDSGAVVSSTTTLNLNQWYHVAVSRDSSNNIRLYVNGTKEDQAVRAEDYNDAGPFEIARNRGATQEYHGYIRDLRIVVGDPVYTADTITVPTAPLTAITNTNLLMCHLPYISDGSTNDHSITVNGGVSTKPFSPYDYFEYSATDPDHGESVYFDGTTDYLISDISSNIFNVGTGDFTAEGWFYFPDDTTDISIIGSGISAGFDFRRVNDGTIRIGRANVAWDTTSAALSLANRWCHIAAVRSSGTVSIYVNGVAQTISSGASNTENYNSSSHRISVGYNGYGGARYGYGNYTDIRLTTSAVYSSNFTPPTAPLSSSGAELHIKGTGASIIDKSQNANLKLVGDTTGSTTQAKFANTKSMYLDGTGDYIQASLTEDNLPNEFTIEGWVYTSTVSGPKGIFGIDTTAFPSTDAGIAVFTRSSTYNYDYAFYCNGNQVNSTIPPTANTWQHFALVRDSNNLVSLYLDGSSIASSTISGTVNGSIITIGGYYSSSYLWNGYIQDFRITKGLARYTANFTPPTASLEG